MWHNPWSRLTWCLFAAASATLFLPFLRWL